MYYTLTAIFCEAKEGVANGRCWPVTIGSFYCTSADALAAIENLKKKFHGSSVEIIDYTITH